MPYILALDQGTTSSRAIVFDRDGAIRAIAQKEFTQMFPSPGWVEHDPQEIWASQIGVAVEALGRAQVRPKDVAAIGITNQRETTIVWDRETGEPIHHAIVWQDRRTADFCERLKAEGAGEAIQVRTGLLIDAYFSASKIRWLLDHVPGARARAEAGKLAFGTVDTWLVWKLTGGACHVTDVSNASRTMLFNIHTLQWDDELLRLFDIPASLLPSVRSSSEVYGQVSTSLGIEQVPVAGIAGDQQAALFGQMCRTPGMSKNTYGTGCFLLQNIGSTPIRSRQQLVTTVAWQVGGRTEYALEERRLLIAGDAGDRSPADPERCRHLAVCFARRSDLRQQARRDLEQPQQVVVPFQRVDVEQHRARRVADIGHVLRAAGQLPDQPRVDRAERELAGFGARPRAGHVVEQPSDLARREIGVDEESGLALDRVAGALRFQPLAEVSGAAILPDDGVVNGFAGLAIPDHGRLALVRDADGRDVFGRTWARPSASTATPICDAQISCGSCSTQPACGKSA